MKIKTIELNNYRAFYRTHTISVQGKSMLIYGENGSGKSSLYKAIEDFFVAANQSKAIEANIFDTNSPYVKVVMDTDEAFEYQNNSTLPAPTPNFLIDTHRHNPFFTYKRLLRAYLTENEAKRPDIFSILIETILPYYTNRKSGQTFGDEWNDINKALQLNASTNKYKQAINTTLPNFNNGLDAFLRDLADKTNDWLNQYFNHHVAIAFKKPTLRIQKEVGKKVLADKEITLILTYFGASIPDRYYEFLNEARLSALAVCMYLASLKIIPEPQNYKMLFLDDIFIGLDMSNRIPLLQILKKEFAEYQIFLTTYDRHWFEVAKDWFERKAKDRWSFLEMYADDASGFEIPHIIPNKAYLKKAEDYILSHDYPAAGMYLRKECERVLTNLLKPAYRVKKVPQDEKTKNYSTEQKSLNDLIIGLKDFCQDENLPYANFEDLAIYKDALLNPLSHHDIETPIYKAELQAIMAVLKELESILIKEISGTRNKDFILRLEKPNKNFFAIEFKPTDSILLIKEPTSNARLLHCCKCEQLSIDDNGTRRDKRKNFDSLQMLYQDACLKFDVPEQDDLLKIITLRGKSLHDMIAEQNLF